MPARKTATPSVTLTWRAGIAYASWSESRVSKRKSLRGADGKPIRDKEQAKRALAEFAAGRLVPDAARKAVMTVGDVLDHYLADRMPRVASPGAIKHASDAIKRHIGDLVPQSMTRHVCRHYAAERRREGRAGIKRDGRPISDGTIIRELVTLRAALRMAMRDGLIAAEPYIEVPSKPPGRERWLTRGEADTLLQNCITPHLRLFVTLGLHTGARTAAILGLRWDRVDLAGGVVDFGDSVGNKRRGRVPLNAVARGALAHARINARSEYVIEWKRARVTCIRASLRRAVDRAGLSGVTAHILRHTCATWLMQGGASAEEIGKFLHDAPETIMRVYGHHSPEWLARSAKILEG